MRAGRWGPDANFARALVREVLAAPAGRERPCVFNLRDLRRLWRRIYSEAYRVALWRVRGEGFGLKIFCKVFVNSTSIRFSSSFPSLTSALVFFSAASIASERSGCLTRCLAASRVMHSKMASNSGWLLFTVVIYPFYWVKGEPLHFRVTDGLATSYSSYTRHPFASGSTRRLESLRNP